MNAHLCGVDPLVADDRIPAELRKQLNILTTNPVIQVPVRRKGITAGEAKRCYWNANLLAQTFGGEAIYGWTIQDITHITDLIILHGHAVWKTPEGKLVDTTPNSLGETNRLFVPLTNQLVMNGKVTEKINTLFFSTGPCGVKISLILASDSIINYGSFGKGKPSWVHGEEKINPNLFTNQLIEVGAIRGDLIQDVVDEVSAKQKHLSNMFDARVRKVDKNTLTKIVCDPNRGFQSTFERCLKRKGANVWEESRGYEFGIDLTCEDMTWDNGTYKNPTLTGISTTSQKSITDYQPLQSILDQHKPPKNKKQRRKVEQIAQTHNLTSHEVVMLSNPYLYPHPTLVKKAGNAKVPRVNTKSVSVGVSSKGFA